MVGDWLPRRLAAGRSWGGPGPVLLQHRAGRVAAPEQVVRPWGLRRNGGRGHGRPRYVMAEPSLQLACGAVTAKLDTRRVNPGARALPGPGLAGFIRSLWVSGSAGQGLREARAYCGRQPGPTIVRVMANRREQTLGTGEIHDPVAASGVPGLGPGSKWDRNLVNWELPDLAGVRHAVATGRVTSRGLRVGTPGPWAGRAKERRPGACPSGFFGGPVPCCRRRHPVVRRTRQRCRAAKATQGGPLQAAHTWAVPRGAAKIWNRGGLEEVGLRPLPMVPVFYRCTVAAQGAGASTRRLPLRRVPCVCPPA